MATTIKMLCLTACCCVTFVSANFASSQDTTDSTQSRSRARAWTQHRPLIKYNKEDTLGTLRDKFTAEFGEYLNMDALFARQAKLIGDSNGLYTKYLNTDGTENVCEIEQDFRKILLEINYLKIIESVKLLRTNPPKKFMQSLTLHYANLSGFILEGLNASEMNMTGIDLSNAKISFCNMTGVILNEAKLQNTKIKFSLYTMAELKAVTLRESSLEGNNFSDADFTESDLSLMKANNCNFSGAHFARAIINKTSWVECNLTQLDLDRLYPSDCPKEGIIPAQYISLSPPESSK